VPDLVAEILSPGTASKDLVRKRWAYEAAGIPEYLIVDPEEAVAELLRLEPEGHYHSVARVEWGANLPILGGRISITLG
jgi:Uma2 family endonuclease